MAQQGIIFDNTSGEVRLIISDDIVTTTEATVNLFDASESFIITNDTEYKAIEIYINDPSGTPTPTSKTVLSDIINIDKTSINTDGIDTATITSIPDNTTITITRRSEEGVDSSVLVITDGILSITANDPCVFKLSFSLVNHVSFDISITAT